MIFFIPLQRHSIPITPPHNININTRFQLKARIASEVTSLKSRKNKLAQEVAALRRNITRNADAKIGSCGKNVIFQSELLRYLQLYVMCAMM
jgi:poly(3-hydroxyalkanoate) synthetase